MIFPRPTKRIGKCLAIVYCKGSNKGGLLQRRSFVAFKGQIWKSNRLSYHLNCEAIPRSPRSLKRGLVLHTCDNDWCIEPKHLYKGTQKENIADMLERNEVWHAKRRAAMLGNTLTLGYRHSEETRRKISRARLGNQNALGHRHSEETRAKMSAAAYRRAK